MIKDRFRLSEQEVKNFFNEESFPYCVLCRHATTPTTYEPCVKCTHNDIEVTEDNG